MIAGRRRETARYCVRMGDHGVDTAQAAELNELFWEGCVSTRMVSALSGVSRARLGRWRRDRILPPTYPATQPGESHIYTWLECCKARAAAKLLARGLPLRELSAVLARIDAEVPQWERAMALPIKDGRLVPGDSAAGSEAIAALRMQAAHCSVGGRAEDETKLIAAVLAELLDEGPLGELSRHSPHITIHPLWLANEPVLTGTRLETALLAAMCAKGFQSVREVADCYEITVEQVRSAVEFEKALAA